MPTDLYVDESSQTQHRYLVVGGIAVNPGDVEEFTQRISQARLPELPHGEMKWTKVSPGKIAAYERVVDAFFEMNRQTIAHFHCLIADTSRMDHKAYNDGSKEIGFSKMIYQILIKFGRIYRHPLYVYLDNRTTQQTPEQLRLICNRGLMRENPAYDWPYRRMVFRDSKASQILQVNDLLLGAIAARRNEHHLREGASEAKASLSARILAHAGIASVTFDTPAHKRHFGVWNFRLR